VYQENQQVKGIHLDALLFQLRIHLHIHLHLDLCVDGPSALAGDAGRGVRQINVFAGRTLRYA
jgi:hypothetical protein